MATIAEFTVPAEAFPLGSLFTDVSDATLELDRIVPTNDTLIPYVWVRGADPAAIEDAAAGHSEVTSMELVDEADSVSLYRIGWRSDATGIVTCIAESDVSLVRGTGRKGEWVFELRADSPDGISRFQQRCADSGIDVTLRRLHTLAESDTRGRYNLTPQQEEALVLAFEEGYYDEPRRTNLQELAEQLDISRPALAARLKRGYGNLVESTLTHR